MVTERRDQLDWGEGGPGLREEDFSSYAGPRATEVNYWVGRGITAGQEVVSNTSIQTLVGGDLANPQLVTPASSGWLDSDLPAAAALSASAALGGATRVIEFFAYGINKFGRPIREFFSMPTGTAAPVINGWSAFHRLTAIEFVTLTNVVGGDTFFIGQRLGAGYTTLAQYAPVFALPIRLGTTREFVTGVTTTLNGAHAAGAGVLAFTSAAAFGQYMVFKIDQGLVTEENLEVKSISGNNVTLRYPASYPHAGGAAIARLDIESDDIVECIVQSYTPRVMVPYDTEAAAQPLLGRMLTFGAGVDGVGRLVGCKDDGTAGEFELVNVVSNLLSHADPNTNVQVFPDNSVVASVPAGMTALVNAPAAADLKIMDSYGWGPRFNFKRMLGAGYSSAATARTDGAFMVVDRQANTIRLGLPFNATTLVSGVDMFYGWQDPSWRYHIRIVCRSSAGQATPRRMTRTFPYPGA